MVERHVPRKPAEARRVKEESGATVLLALKGFACRPLLPRIAATADGACASSPHEARLAREEVGGEVHLFAPAYRPGGSGGVRAARRSRGLQLRLPESALDGLAAGLSGKVDFGLRVNPEHSEGHTPLYDPCAPGSRLGIRAEAISPEDFEGISGAAFPHSLRARFRRPGADSRGV